MTDTKDVLNNGLLSFSNPNYHLNSDDEFNSNIEQEDYEDFDEANLYEELDSVFTLTRKSSVKNRKSYASLDITSMGIDLNADPTTNLNTQSLVSPDSDVKNCNLTSQKLTQTSNKKATDVSDVEKENKTNKYLGYFWEGSCVNGTENQVITDLEASTKKLQSDGFSGKTEDINSPDSNDSGIQADSAIPNSQSEEFALKNKQDDDSLDQTKETDLDNVGGREHESEEEEEHGEDVRLLIDEDKKNETKEVLPPGWEKHEDSDGPYYWHIKSGTIQREPPPIPLPNSKEIKRPVSSDLSLGNTSTPAVVTSPTSSIPSELDSLKDLEGHAIKQLKNIKNEEEEANKPIRFAVRSLGWVEIAEEDLTPERSSKAVNKCIVDLSLGRNDILDVVGRWGDGKDLFMDLDDRSLRLIDPQDMSFLNTQPIHTIRVWGVGRDNGRDFAYVARDRTTRKYMCHVFRCDTPARAIANTLRDICKKIMIERSLVHTLAQPVSTGSTSIQLMQLSRPTNLPTEHRRTIHKPLHNNYNNQSFPTPMEEPRKILKAHYLGSMQVPQAVGIDTLNAAMDKMMATVPPEKWQFVNVAIAPSTITISEHGTDKQLEECRVRYLSFLGIGRNVKNCAFIMHTAQDQFMVHVFHCEPSSGALCKTIEAACKLRYQKCLDAHPQGPEHKKLEQQQESRGIGAAIKSMLGSLTSRRPSKS